MAGPAMNEAAMLEREYATADRLEARRQNVTGWVRGVEPWVEALAAVAEARPHSVLDAGCGDGVFARAVAAPTVVGIDAAPAMVERARSRGVDARLAQIEHLPFTDGSFDVVVCNWTLYHLQDVGRGLAELARVVRPGGRFVGVYNGEGHMEELWSRVHPASGPDEDYTALIDRAFGPVEHRDTAAYTLWETRSDLELYLNAFVELLGPLTVPDGPYPFSVTRRNRVYVAERRA